VVVLSTAADAAGKARSTTQPQPEQQMTLDQRHTALCAAIGRKASVVVRYRDKDGLLSTILRISQDRLDPTSKLYRFDRLMLITLYEQWYFSPQQAQQHWELRCHQAITEGAL
jgi:hypothetical protein